MNIIMYKNIANKRLYNNILHNILLLQKDNKNEYIVKNIYKSLIIFPYNNYSYKILYNFNKTIDKIYISHVIHESLLILNKKESIRNYQEEFINYYYKDSIDNLYILSSDLHHKIQRHYPTRSKFNILPFYVNVFLKKK